MTSTEVIRVALATRPTRRTSAGMRAYAQALLERVPRVAPDVELVAVGAPFALLPLALRRARAQLVHLPYLENPPLLPRPYTAMVHDLIHLRLPELFSRAPRPTGTLSRSRSTAAPRACW